MDQVFKTGNGLVFDGASCDAGQEGGVFGGGVIVIVGSVGVLAEATPAVSV